MASKKKDETAKSVEEQNAEATGEASATEENAGAVESAGTSATENAQATDERSEKSKSAKTEGGGAATAAESTSIVDAVIGTVASAVETVAGTVSGAVGSLVGGSGSDKKETGSGGNRAERIGLVTSDKMTKTVVVRVDRLVKHPKYRKYVRRKKQFMAHDELGATVGDKVRIIETRPLSARKRWRVVEIVQKAAK